LVKQISWSKVEVNKIPFQNPHVTGQEKKRERDVPTAEVYKSNS
jgi:hypothetical protein